LYYALYYLAPSSDFAAGVVAVVFIQSFTAYEMHFTKLLGGIMMSLLVYGLLLKFIAPFFHRWLMKDPQQTSSTEVYATQ
jgi:hypothetical protein